MPARAPRQRAAGAGTRSRPGCTRSTRSSAPSRRSSHIPYMPFQFDINASATTLTRAEFVAQSIAAGRPAADRDPRRQHGPDGAPEPRRRPDDLGRPLPGVGWSRRACCCPDGTTPPISQDPLDHEPDGDARHRRARRPGRERHHLERQRVAVLQRAAQRGTATTSTRRPRRRAYNDPRQSDRRPCPPPASST